MTFVQALGDQAQPDGGRVRIVSRRLEGGALIQIADDEDNDGTDDTVYDASVICDVTVLAVGETATCTFQRTLDTSIEAFYAQYQRDPANDPAINPDATEICDGVDNNCDGAVDEPQVTCDCGGEPGLTVEEQMARAIGFCNEHSIVSMTASGNPTAYGVFVSPDGGATWYISNDLTEYRNGIVLEVARDPGNSSKLLAATYGGGIWTSTDAGYNWSETSTGIGGGSLHARSARPPVTWRRRSASRLSPTPTGCAT